MASSFLRARSAFTIPLNAPRIVPRSRLAPQTGPRRYASTTPLQPSTDSLLIARLKAFTFGVAIGTTLYAVYLYSTDTRAAFHRWAVPPLLRLVYTDAEAAHHAATNTLAALYALNLHPRDRAGDDDLGVSVFDSEGGVGGARLANPIGISAGLDKDAEIPDALFSLGAAVVEVGGITPRPQGGNPQPRVWRVPSLDGMVNRYGLNSAGADSVAARLRTRLRAFARAHGLTEHDLLSGAAGVPPGSLSPGRLLLVQVAKNKDTDERDVAAVAEDYAYCVRQLGPYADVLVVNVSSPNTPGLRDLQATEPLTRILAAVVDEARKTTAAGRQTPPRVMVKVSPDEETDEQLEGICQAVWASGVDGVIVGNTTKRRTGLVPEGVKLTPREQRALMETGGFSGPAMFGRTLDLVKRYRKMLDGHSLRQQDQQTDSEGGGESMLQDAAANVPALEGTVLSEAPLSSPSPPPSQGEEQQQPKGPEQKTIFASGGITNGEQALQVLNAGASVAMVYTSLVYGGAGTITRIKGEIRESVKNG